MSRGISLLIALGGLVAWAVLLAVVAPEAIIDENGHLAVVRRILAGEWVPRGAMPMLPGFHWLIALGSAPFGANLWVGRLCSLTFGLLTVLALHAATSDRGASPWSIFRFAWLPFFVWGVGRVYTEPLALLTVAMALLARVRGRLGWSAFFLLLGCLVRQTTVVWALFFAAWSWLEPSESERAPSRRVQVAGFLSVPLGLALVLWAMWIPPTGDGVSGFDLGRFLAPTAAADDLGGQLAVNPGNFHNLGLMMLVLWLPPRLGRLPDDVRAGLAWTKRHRGAALAAGLVLAAVGAWQAVGYEIAHPWNRGFRGDQVAVLRQLPMSLMEQFWGFRLLGLGSAVAGFALAARLAWDGGSRRLLGLVGLVTLVSLVPHSLVESRYLVLPLVLAEFFLARSEREEKHLAAWYFVLSAAVGLAFVGGWTVLW